MPGIQDWKTSPLIIVDKLFDEFNSSQYVEKVDTFFAELIDKNKSTIPVIENLLGSVRSGSVVQGRYMVQDMFEPEMYADSYRVALKGSGEGLTRCGRYRDLADCEEGETVDFDSSQNIYSERKVYYCVPVPGENDWNKAKKVKSFSESDGGKEAPAGQSTQSSASKRTIDQSESEEGEPMDETLEHSGKDSEAVKKAKVSGGKLPGDDPGSLESGPALGVSGAVSQSKDCHLPLPGDTRLPCILKTYSEGHDLLLNDVVDVCGILSVDPFLTPATEDEEMGENKTEFLAHNPAPSQVPRIHALNIVKVDSLYRSLPPATEDRLGLLGGVRESVLAVRSALLENARKCLCGDALAAEYLLCHLLASEIKYKNEVPIGKCSLNFSKCSPGVASAVHSLVKELKPATCFLPMTLENLNGRPFVPSKDYTANVLRAGLLQLAPGSHMTVDETCLGPGQLTDKGVKNVIALGDLIKWQKVSYDFTYHQKDFPANVSVLVFSEGKSMLPSDAHVPLIRDETGLSGVSDSDWSNLLDTSRQFLALLPQVPYTLEENIQNFVQEDFVNTRRDNPGSMSAEDFEGLLTLAKLLCRSLALDGLSKEVWQRAREMDRNRKARISL